MKYHQLIRHGGILPLFRAIELSVTAAANHVPIHVHAEGLRGTGKTTAFRAAREILPPIERIKGCVYNCDPKNPHCPLHRRLTRAQIEALGTEWIARPFLEISHSAKIASVVGCIDLKKLVDPQNSTAALLPGTIPKAHRGIIFIDEINRLADTSPELADVLLDVMGNKPGRIQIEEAGLPVVELPVEVSIWAASNPDEEPGRLTEVRRQLSDRFDLTIDVKQPNNPRDVASILNRQTSSHTPYSFDLPQTGLHEISLNAHLQDVLASVYVQFKLESLRSIQAIEYIARLQALSTGRKEANLDDFIFGVPMALSHRASKQTIEQILQFLLRIKNNQEPLSGLSAGSICAAPKSVQDKEAFLSRLKRLLQRMGMKIPGLDSLMGRSGKNSDTSHGVSTAKTTEKNVTAPPKKARPITKLPPEDWLNEGNRHE